MTHGPNTPSIPCASIINSQTQKPKQKRKRGKGQGGGWGGTHIQNIQWEFLKPKTSVTLRPNYQYYTLAQHLRARLSKANLGNSLGPTSPPKTAKQLHMAPNPSPKEAKDCYIFSAGQGHMVKPVLNKKQTNQQKNTGLERLLSG